MDRTAKQVIYGGFYLAVLAAFFLLVYLAASEPVPGCLNGKQDDTEEGIDCGDVCGNVCLPVNLRPIAVQSVLGFSATPGTLQILAKVQNPNTALAARTFDYRFDLIGRDGKVIASSPGAGFIYAGEVKYMVAFADGYDTKDVGRVDLKIQDPAWEKGERFAKPKFDIQDRRIVTTDATMTISGRLVHRDTVDMPKVTVIAILQSAGGRPLGISQTELDNVTTGEVRPFAIVHPAIGGVDSSKTELIVSARRP
jgi:hypothetical protein